MGILGDAAATLVGAKLAQSSINRKILNNTVEDVKDYYGVDESTAKAMAKDLQRAAKESGHPSYVTYGEVLRKAP